jgi:squalene cyclase
MSRLVVIEEPERVLVAWEDDPGDWLCAFAKAPEFPARRWADDMARIYNARSALSCASSRHRRAVSDQ